MARAGSVTQVIAAWSARHPRLVVACWLLALLPGAFAWGKADQFLTSHVSVSEHSEAMRGQRLIATEIDPDTSPVRLVCALAGEVYGAVLPADLTPGSEIPARAVTSTVSSIGRCYEARLQAASSDSATGDLPDEVGVVDIVPGADDVADAGDRSGLTLLLPPEIAGISTQPTADAPDGGSVREIAREDLLRADRIGIPLAFLVLLLVTRALIPALLPLLVAGAAVVVAACLVVVAGSVDPVSIYAVNMVVMIGLAIGIDYTLLCLQRYRAERATAASVADAVGITVATAGRAVLTSGLTVAVSIAGLFMVPIGVFHDIALGAIVVIVLSVIGVFTLFPALASLAGRHLEWPRRGHPETPSVTGFWGRAAWIVTRWPLAAVLLVLLPLLLLATQAPEIETGLSAPQTTLLDESGADPQAAYLAGEVSAAVMSTVQIVVSGPRTAEVEAGIQHVFASIGQDKDFAPVMSIRSSPGGDLAVIGALVVRPSTSPEAVAALARLRGDIVPVAFAGQSVTVLVSGPLAIQHDILASIAWWQTWIAGVVLVVSVLVLAFAFRSLVIPVLAVTTTLLSVGAAIGLLTLVFQQGVAASWLGLEQVPAIEAWVPLVLFCVVFGLSMDYHVFLASRIRESYAETGDTRSAIVLGVSATGGLICGAAVIMAVIFGCFATGRLLLLQQVGFGLAAAILIDAIVVRLVLVPASMALLGRWNWYLPAWFGGWKAGPGAGGALRAEHRAGQAKP